MANVITKLLEVRDRNTFIPVIATSMQSDDQHQSYLLGRCGYGSALGDGAVLLARLAGRGPAACDIYDWGDRTMRVAHEYIEREFSALKDGDVIDVEFILGETKAPKTSERVSS